MLFVLPDPDPAGGFTTAELLGLAGVLLWAAGLVWLVVYLVGGVRDRRAERHHDSRRRLGHP